MREAEALGKRYPKIEKFRAVPGVGKIGSLTFDAYIQTPHRFATKQQLWKYCRLGVTDRSSDGKPLGFKRLDKSGNSELKSMSYNAWKGSLITKEPNAIDCFFRASLDRTHNRTKARLSTQRKILTVLWTMWKNEEEYHPELITPGMLRQAACVSASCRRFSCAESRSEQIGLPEKSPERVWLLMLKPTDCIDLRRSRSKKRLDDPHP